jgi:hypothetical protein
MPEIQQYFDKYGWSSFCNTVTWAFTESVELTIPLDIEKMHSTCDNVRKNETMIYSQLEEGDSLKGLTTNELRKNLKQQIDSWMDMPSAQSTSQKTVEGTAGSEHPKYVMLWTNEKLLSQVALSLSASTTMKDMLPLSPSSTIVLEFTQEGSDMNVRTFVNDQLVDTTYCANQTTCKAADFSQALGTALDKAAMDVSKFCGDPFGKQK